jgi:hypothetical protein
LLSPIPAADTLVHAAADAINIPTPNKTNLRIRETPHKKGKVANRYHFCTAFTPDWTSGGDLPGPPMKPCF